MQRPVHVKTLRFSSLIMTQRADILDIRSCTFPTTWGQKARTNAVCTKIKEFPALQPSLPRIGHLLDMFLILTFITTPTARLIGGYY